MYFEDPHQPLRMRHRQRPQHHRIHYAENDGVRADADRQQQDRRNRKNGTPRQQPQSEPHVARKLARHSLRAKIA